MNISFVILSFNRDDIIAKNIDAIYSCIGNITDSSHYENDFEIIVVDNNSTDETDLLLSRYINNNDFRIIKNNENLGVAKGRNCGLNASRGNWIVILDDDSILPQESMKLLLDATSIPNETGIFALNVKNMNTGLCFSDDLVSLNYISNFHGAGHIINRNVVNDIGYLDEMCEFGGEELDYSIRCRKAGYSIELLNDCIVEHYCRIRNGSEGFSRRSKWIYNYIRVIAKHFPLLVSFKFAIRYSISHIVNVKFNKDISMFSGVKMLVVSSFKGYISGRAHRNKISGSLLKLYTSQKMRPQYGNVSILNRVIERNRRK